jgi:RNA polymerase sigma factor (sigma-70 family)
VNLSIDRWRRNKRRGQTFSPLVEGDHLDALKDTRPAPDRGLLHRDAGSKVEQALRTLPERQRAVVVLRHYQELSLEEIAATLGISLGTVKSSLHRALHRMRETLAGGGA